MVAERIKEQKPLLWAIFPSPTRSRERSQRDTRRFPRVYHVYSSPSTRTIRMDPKTPDRAKGTRNLHDTPLAPITSNGPPHGFKVAKDALDAVRAELKSCTASIGKKVDDNGLDELYARLEIKDDYIESLLATHSLKAEYEGGRWKRIPVKVQDEKDLYAPLTVLFNKLFHFFEADGKFGSGTRSFIVTASKMQWHDDASTPHDPLAAARVGTMPDFLVVGQDDSQLPHPLEESITHEEYRRTIVIGDAKKKKEGRAESQEDRAQVVSYGRLAHPCIK